MNRHALLFALVNRRHVRIGLSSFLFRFSPYASSVVLVCSRFPLSPPPFLMHMSLSPTAPRNSCSGKSARQRPPPRCPLLPLWRLAVLPHHPPGVWCFASLCSRPHKKVTTKKPSTAPSVLVCVRVFGVCGKAARRRLLAATHTDRYDTTLRYVYTLTAPAPPSRASAPPGPPR